MRKRLYGPCDFYQIFDNQWQLIYVGISRDSRQRLAQHRRSSVWWPRAYHVTVMRYDSRDVAESVEAEAIRCERPRYNVDPGSRRARTRHLTEEERMRREVGYIEFGFTPNYRLEYQKMAGLR